jgi:hypothetical protein
MTEFPIRIIESEDVPPGVVYVIGPPPKRSDYATEQAWLEACRRRVSRIVNVEVS